MDLIGSRLRPVCVVAVVALLAWNATLTAHDYFAIWPKNAEVRWLYQATWAQAARWLDSSADTTPVAASGLKIHDLDPQTFDILMNQYLFDILPVDDFFPIMFEFKRVLKDGGRIVLVNMTKGERRLNQIYEEIYKLRPPLLAGCRGVFVAPFLDAAGFEKISRQFVSQLAFPSEVVCAFKRGGRG
jgi:hypothetical protein